MTEQIRCRNPSKHLADLSHRMHTRRKFWNHEIVRSTVQCRVGAGGTALHPLNVASMKHRYNLYSPRSSTSRPASRMKPSKTPASTHGLKQQCTAFLLPNRRGRFFHFAPLSRSQKMPATAARLSVGDRSPSGLRGTSGTREKIQSCCASVSRVAMYSYARHDAMGSPCAVALALGRDRRHSNGIASGCQSPFGEISASSRREGVFRLDRGCSKAGNHRSRQYRSSTSKTIGRFVGCSLPRSSSPPNR